MSSPFLYSRRITRLDELGQTFVIRLVMRLQHKDEYKRIMRLDELCFEIRLDEQGERDRLDEEHVLCPSLYYRCLTR